MEFEFINELQHNYLSIKCSGDQIEASYQYRMFLNNTIKGLLPCDVRNINGFLYFYYEINSKQSLENRYEITEMDRGSLEHLLWGIIMLQKELQKFLLDDSCIILDSKYIFQDIDSNKTFFVYLPSADISGRYTVKELMEYIVKKINHKDQKAVKIAYQIYDISRNSAITSEELSKILDEHDSCKAAECELPELEDNAIGPDAEKQESVTVSRPTEEQTERKNPLSVKIMFIMAALLVIGTILLTVLEWTYTEMGILIAFMACDIAGMIFVGFSAFVRGKAKNTEEVTYTKRECRAEKGLTHDLEQTLSRTNGETVYVDIDREAENILYGIGKYDKYTIQIDHFPYLIGKKQDAVDYVLDEVSVSRLHAGFTYENDQLYIKDMNSTNGTFRNGFRLKPNETAVLAPGDEISFGKIRFIYR